MGQHTLQAQTQVAQVGTIAGLTGIYESIASMRIARIKERVTRSQVFFAELWSIYSQLRIDPHMRLTGKTGPKRDKPNVYLVLTSEGGLSGDIDSRIVREVIDHYDPATTDLVVVGAHGATQFVQRGIKIKRYFRLPDIDQSIDVSPIIRELLGYTTPTVWYQRYISLAQQDTGRIDLLSQVRSLGTESDQSDATTDIISPRDYLFEPGVEEVIHYLESVMMEIALSQVILDSRLAQYASRFTAMTGAKKRASELKLELVMRLSRARRGEQDEMIKEAVNAMNAMRQNP